MVAFYDESRLEAGCARKQQMKNGEKLRIPPTEVGGKRGPAEDRPESARGVCWAAAGLWRLTSWAGT
jgi:hypothetical protein